MSTCRDDHLVGEQTNMTTHTVIDTYSFCIHSSSSPSSPNTDVLQLFIVSHQVCEIVITLINNVFSQQVLLYCLIYFKLHHSLRDTVDAVASWSTLSALLLAATSKGCTPGLAFTTTYNKFQSCGRCSLVPPTLYCKVCPFHDSIHTQLKLCSTYA